MLAIAAATVEKRAMRQLKLRRPSLLKLRAKLTKRLARFLRQQARSIADQINLKRATMGKLTEDQQRIVDETLDAIDFSGWSILVGDVQDIFDEIVKDGSYAALAQIDFDTEADPGVAGIINAAAYDYASARSAELVGMKRLETGALVDNPDAEWAITDSTRDGLRQSVADAIDQGWSNDRLAEEIEGAYAFSDERAMVIARTETNMASNSGALSGYKASGVVEQKIWLTAEDDLVDEEECGPNGDQGPIDLNDAFQSGDDAPPAHPNCRCVLAPVITQADEAVSGDEE